MQVSEVKRNVKDIVLVDSTLREGEQTPNVHFLLNQKIEIVQAIDDFFNSDKNIIELGSPYVPQQFEDVKTLAKLELRSQTMAHLRALEEDVDVALKCDTEWVALLLALSEQHRRVKLNGMSKEEALDRIRLTTQYAKDHGFKVRVTLEDASATDLNFLIQAAKLAEEVGADRISIPDTRGIIMPYGLQNSASLGFKSVKGVPNFGIHDMVTAVAESVMVPLDVHCHNDFGLATVNLLVGFEAGATGLHVCVNGLGGRCGITPLHELVIGLYTFYGIDLGVRYKMLPQLSELVGDYSGIHSRDNDPIVGRNAFSHKAGTHQKAVAGDPTTFEIINPDLVGRRRRLVMSELSGRHGINAILKGCGVQVTPEVVRKITQSIKDFEHEKGFMTDQDALRIIQRLTGTRYENLLSYMDNVPIEALVSIKLDLALKPEIHDVITSIKSMRGIKSLWEVSGTYDLTALINAGSLPELNTCLDVIRTIDGVDATKTQVVVNKWP